jgi:hypothetical protein
MVPRSLMSKSGRLFYSGRSAFSRPSDIYLLGLNPGGTPSEERTIERSIRRWQRRREPWSAYVDESWGGNKPGESPMQRRVRHLLGSLGLDPRAVPASNAVFVRTTSESGMKPDKGQLLTQCWEVHDYLISGLEVRAILCLGATAGRWCREKLGAHELVDSMSESNGRGWTSRAHLADDGRAVITLSHPSRADWCSKAADPTPLVRRVLQRHVRLACRRRP